MQTRQRFGRAGRWLLGATTAFAALPGAAMAAGAAGGQAIDMRSCFLTVHVFSDSQQRMAGYVPEGYEFAGWPEQGGGAPNPPLPAAIPTRAQPLIFAAGCESIGDTRDAVITLAGVAVRKRPAPADNRVGYGVNEHHVYLHSIQTNNEDLAELMDDTGLPARHVKGMKLTRSASDLALPGRAGIPSTRVVVPWRHRARDASFGVWTDHAAMPDNTPPHDHTNAFWYGPADNAARLDLHFTQALDQYFCRLAPTCNGAWARPGSPIAQFLGATERHGAMAFDHERIDKGSLTVTPAAD